MAKKVKIIEISGLTEKAFEMLRGVYVDFEAKVEKVKQDDGLWTLRATLKEELHAFDDSDIKD